MSFRPGKLPLNSATPGVRDAPGAAKAHGVGSEGPSQNRTIGGEGQGSPNLVLAEALRLAALGFRVFPVYPIRKGRCACGKDGCDRPGKHPIWQLARHGLKDATTDPAVIRAWWIGKDGWPDANVGMVTDNAPVVDVDPSKGGLASLNAQVAQHGKLKAAAVARSGGDGWHFIFAPAPGLTVPSKAGQPVAKGGLGEGLDTRGVGGYIVVAPSRHISGGVYRWVPGYRLGDRPLTPYPAWLIPPTHAAGTVNAGLTPGVTPQGKPPEAWAQLIGAAIPKGGRNDAIAALSGYFIHFLDPLVALSTVLAINDARCREPLSESEVVKTFESVARAELQKRKEAQRG